MLGAVVKDVEGAVTMIDNPDRVRERMGIEHRADEGHVDRGIVHDDDGPRWGREGLLHNRLSYLRAVRARHTRQGSETSKDAYVQNGSTMLS
jgi:hypothetical protein